MDRQSTEPNTAASPPTPNPDTEPTGPLTPADEHISVDIDSGARLTRPSGSGPMTLESAEHLSVTQQSRMSPLGSTKAALPPEQDSNTTLQSMMRPENSSAGVPHTRRFMSIERELEQLGASIKLLEKRLERTKRDVKVAWIAAAAATLLGLAGTLL